ncbi:MAG TPA: hypothetical protein VEK06_05305, partial [Myxococcota bacterium]|nr:hypothetical protein [Myxococcota bacterium]
DQEFGDRFHVFLEDHSAESCTHNIGKIWKAEVRRGFGWCGTMDAFMELTGIPVAGLPNLATPS